MRKKKLIKISTNLNLLTQHNLISPWHLQEDVCNNFPSGLIPTYRQQIMNEYLKNSDNVMKRKYDCSERNNKNNKWGRKTVTEENKDSCDMYDRFIEELQRRKKQQQYAKIINLNDNFSELKTKKTLKQGITPKSNNFIKKLGALEKRSKQRIKSQSSDKKSKTIHIFQNPFYLFSKNQTKYPPTVFRPKSSQSYCKSKILKRNTPSLHTAIS